MSTPRDQAGMENGNEPIHVQELRQLAAIFNSFMNVKQCHEDLSIKQGDFATLDVYKSYSVQDSTDIACYMAVSHIADGSTPSWDDFIHFDNINDVVEQMGEEANTAWQGLPEKTSLAPRVFATLPLHEPWTIERLVMDNPATELNTNQSPLQRQDQQRFNTGRSISSNLNQSFMSEPRQTDPTLFASNLVKEILQFTTEKDHKAQRLRDEKEERLRKEEKEERLRVAQEEKEERLRKEEKEERLRKEEKEERLHVAQEEKEERLRKEEKEERARKEQQDFLLKMMTSLHPAPSTSSPNPPPLEEPHTPLRTQELPPSQSAAIDHPTDVNHSPQHGSTQPQASMLQYAIEAQTAAPSNDGNFNTTPTVREGLVQNYNTALPSGPGEQRHRNLQDGNYGNYNASNSYFDCITLPQLPDEVKEVIDKPPKFSGEKANWRHYKNAIEMYLAKTNAYTKLSQLAIIQQTLLGSEYSTLDSMIAATSKERFNLKDYWQGLDERFQTTELVPFERDPIHFLLNFAWDGRKSTFNVFMLEVEQRYRKAQPLNSASHSAASSVVSFLPPELLTKIRSRDLAIHRPSPWNDSTLLIKEVEEIFREFEQVGSPVPWAETWPYYKWRKGSTHREPVDISLYKKSMENQGPKRPLPQPSLSNQDKANGSSPNYQRRPTHTEERQQGGYNQRFRRAPSNYNQPRRTESNGNYGHQYQGYGGPQNYQSGLPSQPCRYCGERHFSQWCPHRPGGPRQNGPEPPTQQSQPSNWSQAPPQQTQAPPPQSQPTLQREGLPRQGQNSQPCVNFIGKRVDAWEKPSRRKKGVQRKEQATNVSTALPSTKNRFAALASKGREAQTIGLYAPLSMDIDVSGITTPALIDTGATIVAVSRKMATKLVGHPRNGDIRKADKLQRKEMEKNEREKHGGHIPTISIVQAREPNNLRVAPGHDNGKYWTLTDLLEGAQITFRGQTNTFDCWIYEDGALPYDVILGMPALLQLGFNMTLPDDTYCFNDASRILQSHPKTKQWRTEKTERKKLLPMGYKLQEKEKRKRTRTKKAQKQSAANYQAQENGETRRPETTETTKGDTKLQEVGNYETTERTTAQDTSGATYTARNDGETSKPTLYDKTPDTENPKETDGDPAKDDDGLSGWDDEPIPGETATTGRKKKTAENRHDRQMWRKQRQDDDEDREDSSATDRSSPPSEIPRDGISSSFDGGGSVEEGIAQSRQLQVCVY